MAEYVKGVNIGLDNERLKGYDGALVVVVNGEVGGYPRDEDVLLIDKEHGKAFPSFLGIHLLSRQRKCEAIGWPLSSFQDDQQKIRYDVERENLLREGRLKMAVLVNTGGGNWRGPVRVGRAKDAIEEKRGIAYSFVGNVAESAGADFAVLPDAKNRLSLENARYLWHTSSPDLSDPSTAECRAENPQETRETDRRYRRQEQDATARLFAAETKRRYQGESAAMVANTEWKGRDLILDAKTLHTWGLIHALFANPLSLQEQFAKTMGIIQNPAGLQLAGGSISRFFTLLRIEQKIREEYGVLFLLETDGDKVLVTSSKRDRYERGKKQKAKNAARRLFEEARQRDENIRVAHRLMKGLFQKKR